MIALLNPVTILLAVMCIQWVVLAELGPFTILVPYAALALVGLYGALGTRKLRMAALYVRENVIWLLPLITYLLMITPILYGSPGANAAPRQIFYMICGIGLAACVATARNIGTIFRVGAALGLLVFAVAVELLARRIGLTWLDPIVEFFVRGNLHFVIYSFFTPIFNSLDTLAVNQFDASTKNSVAGCVLVLALLFRSGSRKPEGDILGMVFLGISLGLLVMINDRSVLIATGGSLLIAVGVGAAVRPVKNAYWLAAKVIALLGLAVLAIANASSASGLTGTLADRFAFEDNSTAARLLQFRSALAKIEQHPFVGNGYFEVDGHPIHNAFLGAWTYGGILAFLLVVAFYVAVWARWLSFLASIVRHRKSWVLPFAVEWIAPLPLMPLFRVWLSGEGGVLKFSEWIAISIFFGCLVANRARVARMMRSANIEAARRSGDRTAAFPPFAPRPRALT